MTGKERREREFVQSILAALRGIEEQLRTITSALHPVQKQKNANGSNQATDQQNGQPQSILVVRSITEPGNAESHQRQAERESTDKFQRRALLVQWCLFGATLLAFGAAAFYAYVANVQKETMRRQLEATDRPWIKVAMNIEQPITFDKQGQMWAYLAFSVINVGKSVATSLSIRSDMLLDGLQESPETALKQQKALCGAVPRDPGFLLFPGDSRSLIVPRRVPPSYINSHLLGAGYVLPYIVGCADYHIAALPGNHQTGFIYVFGIRSQSPLPTGFALGHLPVGKETAADQIDIHPWFINGGDYAY